MSVENVIFKKGFEKEIPLNSNGIKHARVQVYLNNLYCVAQPNWRYQASSNDPGVINFKKIKNIRGERDIERKWAGDST